MALQVIPVFQAVAEQDVHHAKGECCIAARVDGEMNIGESGRFRR